MAQRRMFSKTIIESDTFLDMSLSTQALYFHLGMQADDDGFVSPNRIMRMVGSQPDDLKVLIAKNFVIPFENGVTVIRHWKENNYIQKDRKKDTIYIKELAKLSEEGNGVYKMDTKCIQNVHVGKGSIGKDRLGKDRIGKVIIASDESLADNDGNEINKVLEIFYKINPTINFGNKTQRKSVDDLIKKLGFEKTVRTVEYAVSVQGERYAPVITTPVQLKNKLGDLISFWRRSGSKQNKIIDLDNLNL